MDLEVQDPRCDVRQGFLVEQFNLYYDNIRGSSLDDGLGEVFVWATKIENLLSIIEVPQTRLENEQNTAYDFFL